MEKEKILAKIIEIEKDIEKDEHMMKEEPESIYWCEDYSFNTNLLARYKKCLTRVS